MGQEVDDEGNFKLPAEAYTDFRLQPLVKCKEANNEDGVIWIIRKQSLNNFSHIRTSMSNAVQIEYIY